MKPIVGIELGSTRIKSVATDEKGRILAEGSHTWENEWKNNEWTYSEQAIRDGLQRSFASLAADWKRKTGTALCECAAIGVSAMMHGYIASDKAGKLLVPFRTWRNTDTGEEAAELTELFGFPIPMRWSIAHLYRAIRRNDAHVRKIDYVTTLAGYVHTALTGERVLGVGDASGMFPVDPSTCDYDAVCVQKFDALTEPKKYGWKLRDIFPAVAAAGKPAGYLTREGALLLDPSGTLHAGAPLCPPEGDAGTGMVATNSIAPGTGNVSAGTSAFCMVVLGKNLSKVHREIDIVTTPEGRPVAMVHVNNCTSEINEWARLFAEAAALAGAPVTDFGQWMEKLFTLSLQSGDGTGGLTGYNFQSGEPIAGADTGAPLCLRKTGEKPTLADFMQMQIYASLAALHMGMDVLRREGVTVRDMCGHGGFFKTKFVGQNAMSAAVDAPVTVMKNAGEGGAWGIALLAAYAVNTYDTLEDFLREVFRNAERVTVTASDGEKKKFAAYMERYRAYLPVERMAAAVAEKETGRS